MAVVVDFLLSGFTDESGQPLSGGLVYSYSAGTSTPKSLYTNSAGTIADTNPVELDSNGRKQVYASGAYKLVINDADDNLLYTFDNLFFGAGVGFSWLGTTSGSSNAYVATPSPALIAYTDGDLYAFQANFTNTSTATLNVSGLGAKTVSSIVGQIISGFTYIVRYSSSANAFTIVNPSPGYATTQAEMAALESAGVPIVVRQSITMTGNLTLTVPLKIEKNGMIVTGANILTINGSFEAGMYQCFNTTATKVIFGDFVPKAYPQWFGALGDSTTDDTSAVQAALDSTSHVFFPAGDYRITSTLTCAHATLIEGIIPPTSAPTPYISVLRHDFSGTFISFTGSAASGYGGGGGLRNIQLYNAFGSSSNAYGVAILLTFTSTALRPTWLRIENVNIEHGASTGTWTYCIDFDGSAASTTDSLRDYWISGCRFLCETGGTAAVRLRKVVGLHFVNNILNGAQGNMTITGDGTTSSGQNWIHGGGGGTLALDYASNTHISGSLWAAITDTTNTVDTTIRASKCTAHIRLNGTGFADYYKDTEGTHIHQSNGQNFIFSRDAGAGDTAFGVGVGIGNHGANEGFCLSEYANAAASGSPYFQQRFLPRNNADSGLLSAGQYAGIYYTKTAGADTCKTEIMSTGGTITINANGSVSLSGTKVELGGVGSNLMITSGSGTPEGSITAVVGSLYLRTNGGASTTLYVKESGSGNTGWVGK